jgi:hypothetical protein
MPNPFRTHNPGREQRTWVDGGSSPPLSGPAPGTQTVLLEMKGAVERSGNAVAATPTRIASAQRFFIL